METRSRVLAIAAFGLAALHAGPAAASHMTTLGVVDFIDATFGPGGGSYTKSLTSGADDGWAVFAANAGDTITITFSATSGTSGAPAAYDGAGLFETNDGVVAVNDAVNVTDFSMNQFGNGTDLVIQHQGFNPVPSGYQFTNTAPQTVVFNAASSGQYAVGVSCSDEVCVNGSTFTVQVSGNTAAVPEPASAALLALGLMALAARPRR